MRDLGWRLHHELTKRGITSRVFWSGRGDYIGGLVAEVRGANAYKAQHFISLHSDAAGPVKNNTILVLYVSPEGRQLGEALGGHLARRLGARLEFRQRTNLYVLNRSNMPAVLIELYNHSNTADTMRLLDHNFRQQIAKNLAESYAGYVGVQALPVPAPQAPKEVRIAKSAKAHLDAVIGRGNIGATVAAAQVLLQAKGYDVNADGLFGPDTAATVKEFQSHHALSADSIVGPQTWNSLRDPATAPRTVAYGDTGRAVTMLQEAINRKRPGWRLAVDSVFGEHTNSAVRIYQRETRLRMDGVVGGKTWQNLNN
jgi:murein L,D-transpeptidase YcbB/YkuD